jgi:murein L,D-transpeptidase YcbB/YkuD
MLIVVLTLSWFDCYIPRVRASQSSALSGQSDLSLVQAHVAEVKAAIEASLVSNLDSALGVPQEQLELKKLYLRRGHLPLWVDAAGRPGHDADDAVTILRGAADEGLNIADYGVDLLDRITARSRSSWPLSIPDVASFDVALSMAMLRYFHHAHNGRVDPRTLGLRLTLPADRHDFAALLASAVSDHRMAETVADLRPQLAQYRALRRKLSQYRSIARDADSPPSAFAPVSRVVHPGEPCAGLDALRRRLVVLGDLPAGTPADAELTVYGGALVEGVRRFQVRHGLASDGVLGKSTQAALRVPLARRIRQIDLALERLRWLPHLGAERLVAINIPMFRLWAWDTIQPNGDPSFGMDVIVGRALRTQTPVFVEQLRKVIFRPYWNVPPSIVRHEIFPILARDPEYLTHQQMEIVRGSGDDALVVAATAANLVLLRQGTLRLRQRPGPHNALGLVKFVIPNAENVYMHGTPAQELFGRSRRDFSHGCVRVENPIALAEWALKERPEWTRDRIVSAMTGTQSIHVPLLRPIQVILFYTTAAVMPDDGTIRFAEDIYRHDAKLDRALARRGSAE